MFPVLFLADHFGKLCRPIEVLNEAFLQVLQSGNFEQRIGDWTLRLFRDQWGYCMELS